MVDNQNGELTAISVVEDEKVGYKRPPKKHQFKKGHKPTKGGGRPKGVASPTAALRRLLDKKIDVEDPETKKMNKLPIADAIALRHVLNACQGEHNSIVDIFDRIDGKVGSHIEGATRGIMLVEWDNRGKAV